MTAPPELVGWQFLAAEDEALKIHLADLVVTDLRDNPTRPVTVRYRHPEVEFSDSEYPLVTIEFAGTRFDRERAMSYHYELQNYLPDEASGDLGVTLRWLAPYPIPMMAMYVISSLCRNPIHDVSLRSQLSASRLNPRYAAIHVPHDNTLRRLVVLQDMLSADYIDGNGKRVFHKSWTIGIPTELLPEQAVAVNQLPPAIATAVLDGGTQSGFTTVH